MTVSQTNCFAVIRNQIEYTYIFANNYFHQERSYVRCLCILSLFYVMCLCSVHLYFFFQKRDALCNIVSGFFIICVHTISIVPYKQVNSSSAPFFLLFIFLFFHSLLFLLFVSFGYHRLSFGTKISSCLLHSTDSCCYFTSFYLSPSNFSATCFSFNFFCFHIIFLFLYLSLLYGMSVRTNVHIMEVNVEKDEKSNTQIK